MKKIYHLYTILDYTTLEQEPELYYVGCYTNLKQVAKAITAHQTDYNRQFKVVIKYK